MSSVTSSQEIFRKGLWRYNIIFLPMVPFLIGFFIRLLLSMNLWQSATYSASDLSIILALLSLSISHTLLKNCRALENEDRSAETEFWAHAFHVFFMTFLVFFIIIVICSTLTSVNQSDLLEKPMYFCAGLTYVLTFIVLIISEVAQRSFCLWTLM